jgi:TolB protein
MSKVDDELTRRLHQAERPVDTDALFEGLEGRRSHRERVRRAQAALLAFAVLTTTVVGFITLTRAFRETPQGSVGSPFPLVPKENGLLVYADGSSLFTISPDGGETSRIRGIPRGAWLPAWSPDGRRLAVAIFPPGTGPRELWVADADGSNATKVAEADNVSQPSWSPDGSRLTYAADTKEGSAVHIVDVDGSGDRIVGEVAQGEDYFSATFSPDGTQILFDRGTDVGFGIYVMDADGADVRRVGQGESDYDPAWSPSGLQIAFTRQEKGAESDIFVMNADGSAVRRLTDGPSGDTNLSPTFAPDGTAIAYVSGKTGGPGGLVVIDTDGGSPRTIVDQGVLGIAWQPLPGSTGLSTTLSPGPSVSPQPGVSGLTEGSDIGLGFNLCNNERLGSIDFLGDGTPGAAWIGVPTNADGTCPRNIRPGKYVVAEDHTGDGVADSWLDLPWQCYVDCVPFDATDLDANGTEELVVASYFSIMDYYVMGLQPNAEGALEIRPLLVAEPGHEPVGLIAGEPLRIDAGGDEGYGSQIECEGYPDAPVLIWSWSNQPVETNLPREVHITRLQLRTDGLFHVVATNDYTVPAGQPGIQRSTAPACGVDFHPNA